jgi:sugar phosphate isomerase/epimerase
VSSTCSICRARCARGFGDLDICHFHLPHTDDRYLAALRERLDAADVRVLTFLVDDGDISAADATARERDVAMIRDWIDIAARLGARSVRVAAGLTAATPDAPAIRRSVEGLATLARHARGHALALITETWRPLAMPPENVHAILEATGGSVGLCVDFNNYHQYSGPAKKYDDLRVVMPDATMVHAGAQFDAAGAIDEPDLRRCMALAREAGFAGPYVPIYSGPGDEWAALVQLAAIVRGCA